MARITYNMRNIRHLLFILWYLGISYTTHANDLLFTSINTSQGLSDNQIRYILQLPDGRMVFTTNGNVNLYDGTHFSYLHRTQEDLYPLQQYDGFYRIYHSSDSLLWIKDHHKLMCINLHTERYVTRLNDYFQRKGIRKPVDNLFVDHSGRTWLLTSGALVQPENGIRLPLPNEAKQLQDIDADLHSLYLFYNTGEISCYDLANLQLQYTVAAYPATERENFQRTSLIIKGEKGFYQLRNGRKGGFFYFNPQKRTWKKLFEQDYTLNTLVVTPHDELAYISCIHGFWKIDLMNGRKEYLPTLKTRKGQLVSTEISTLFQDRQGGLWVGTFNRGLLYYHPAMYKLTYTGRSSFPVSPEEDLAIEAFAEDKDGNIYLKSHARMYRLEANSPQSRIVKAVTTSSLPPQLLEQLNRKPTRYTDSRGWTWTGTADGLELITRQGHPARTFYRENGLANDFVQAIIEDNRKDIWATTSNGISRIHIDPASQTVGFTNYNQLDGALEGEYLSGSAFQSSDGTLYFGGIDGFNTFHPNHESATPGLPYPPVFTSLRIHGEKVGTGKPYGKRIPLPKSAPYTTMIELDYHQNFLTFEFSALNYVNSERTYYRYRLEGIDKDWNSVFTEGEGNASVGNGKLQASYTNLSPGNYVLKVMATDNILRWNGKTTEVQLIIHAPWWQTTTAYIGYVVFLLLILATGISLYVRQTKKRMERLHKEEILLLRIRNLIEQCNQYEEEQKKSQEEPKGNNLSDADAEFLSRAIGLVEQNLHVSGYSVEQLSRDLCMERTGLYRKLTASLDQSPSLFIRNIRLQRAAQLIRDGQLSITEIAERTGFSSTSYLSKCFQEMYGCKPSEYAKK